MTDDAPQQPVIDDGTLERLREEAKRQDITIDKLLAQRLAPIDQGTVGVPLYFSCPEEDCGFRSGTLAGVCPEHGVHVV